MSSADKGLLNKDWRCRGCGSVMPKGTPIARSWDPTDPPGPPGAVACWDASMGAFRHRDCPDKESAADGRNPDGPPRVSEAPEPASMGHLYVAAMRDYCMVEIAARFNRFKLVVGSHAEPEETLDALISRVKTTARRRFDEERDRLRVEEADVAAR